MHALSLTTLVCVRNLLHITSSQYYHLHSHLYNGHAKPIFQALLLGLPTFIHSFSHEILFSLLWAWGILLHTNTSRAEEGVCFGYVYWSQETVTLLGPVLFCGMLSTDRRQEGTFKCLWNSLTYTHTHTHAHTLGVSKSKWTHQLPPSPPEWMLQQEAKGGKRKINWKLEAVKPD